MVCASLSFAGREVDLRHAGSRTASCRPTPLFARIKRDAIAQRPKLIVIDTVADAFGGKEIDRAQTRQYHHPACAGLPIDAGSARRHRRASEPHRHRDRHRLVAARPPGTTACARGCICKPRRATTPRCACSKSKRTITARSPTPSCLRWKDGVYVVRARQVGTLQRLADEQDVDHLFLKLLRRLADQGRNVSDKVSSSYAPSVFASEPEAKAAKASKKAFAEAMARLFAARENPGRPIRAGRRRMRSKIVRSSAKTAKKRQPPPFPPSNARSDDLPTPSDDLPTGCDTHTPHTPHARWKRARGRWKPRPIQRAPKRGYSARVEVGDRDGPARRPRITGDLELIGVEPPGTACVHCGQADGTPVYLVRDPRQGVASQPLHESCAAAFFKRGGS